MTDAKKRYDKEVSDASQALIDWFSSQSIKPEMSIDVMTMVIATILTEIEDSREGIQEKFDRIHDILTEYADWIERRDFKKRVKP